MIIAQWPDLLLLDADASRVQCNEQKANPYLTTRNSSELNQLELNGIKVELNQTEGILTELISTEQNHIKLNQTELNRTNVQLNTIKTKFTDLNYGAVKISYDASRRGKKNRHNGVLRKGVIRDNAIQQVCYYMKKIKIFNRLI